MTKVIAINGSPRKNWNTAIMLQSANGLCVYKDALTTILEKCKEADAVILLRVGKEYHRLIDF